jgi:type IV pilus assembly protein PilX
LIASPHNAKREQGVTLVIVLVVVGVVLVANLALMRSMSTVNRVASNKSFKQAATQAAEVGLRAAENYIAAIAAPDTAVANRYAAVMQASDANELPTSVNWTNVATTDVGNYDVKWVVDRMCDRTPVTDPITQCLGLQTTQQGSKKAGSPSYASTTAVYYRITVQVTGPRNIETYVQSAVAR